MKLFDISLLLNEKTPIYPKNPKFKVKTIQGNSSILSKIELGTHSATHIDAPAHVFPNRAGISDINLELFYGNCRVLDFSHAKNVISLEDLLKKEIKAGQRILLKTQNSAYGLKTFRANYIYLSGDGADFLASLPVKLVGIDALSIKQKGSSDLRPHTSLLNKNIPIIEGLDLSKISEGNYILIAFPLKLQLEGAPVRAVLLKP